MVENSIGLVTALNPLLGYEKSTQIASQALATGRLVYEIVLEIDLIQGANTVGATAGIVNPPISAARL